MESPAVAAGVVRRVLDSLPAVVQENILLLAAVTAAVVALVGWGIFRLTRESPPEAFRSLVANHDELTVLMHPDPDPDAMSCAMAVRELAESVDTDVTLQHSGQIRHQENRVFETVLDLDSAVVESESELASEDVVLVDHNEPRGFPGARRVNPIAVVDHHPGGGTGEEFTDVRTDNGSCASILAEYFADLGWEPTPPDAAAVKAGASGRRLSSRVATGLLYGIQSDTAQLTTGCSTAEFEGARYLYSGIDEDLLDRIANPEMDAEVLDVKATAIRERDVRNAFAVSDVGSVSNMDAIPQAADELLRLEGVTAVVVFGDSDGDLRLSGRSRDDRVHMGKTLQAVVKDVPMSSAGGHARMGGGQLSIEHMNGIGLSDGMNRVEFQDRLFDAMVGDI